jgi:predicted nuclease of predicted toxin-antitoxin system
VRFLADIGISQQTVRWLREKGPDAAHLREEGLQRATDETVLDKALSEERIVLTLDLDFSDLVAASGRKLPSVISFRLGNSPAKLITERLENTLTQCQMELEQGAIVSVSQSQIRVRILPI